MQHSSIITLSKRCGWFLTDLHHYKQTTCIGSPMVDIFKLLNPHMSKLMVEPIMGLGCLGFMAYQPL